MKKLYTAVGILKQRKGKKGLSYPYVEIGKREFVLDTQEMLLWSVLNWRILSEPETEALYQRKIKELGLEYHKSFDACQYHLMQRGLIAEGVGESGADALYDLFSNLYIVPISENIFIRTYSFVKLTLQGIPFSATKRILFRDKRNEGEDLVMSLANQAIFSTAELIKCVEQKKTNFKCDEDILDALYSDEDTTSENIAYSAKSSPVCREVLTNIANLYLRQQVVLGRM